MSASGSRSSTESARTEMFVTFCSNRPVNVGRGTTGRPVPGYELRLTDDAGDRLDGSEVGKLGGPRASLRGVLLAPQREDAAQHARRVVRDGDRFERREDGTYVYVGRADDMLKIGGLWVSPIDMERVLLEHPAVAGAGVVGVNIDGYNRVAAFVSATPRRGRRRSSPSHCARGAEAHARLRISAYDPVRR